MLLYKNLLTCKYKNDKISKEQVLPWSNGSPWLIVASKKQPIPWLGGCFFDVYDSSFLWMIE